MITHNLTRDEHWLFGKAATHKAKYTSNVLKCIAYHMGLDVTTKGMQFSVKITANDSNDFLAIELPAKCYRMYNGIRSTHKVSILEHIFHDHFNASDMLQQLSDTELLLVPGKLEPGIYAYRFSITRRIRRWFKEV